MADTATQPPTSAFIEAELAKYKEAEKVAQDHLATFDKLDFQVYSHQDWSRMGESHRQDIKVHQPDGSIINGLHDHIEDLKKTFVFAPDTCIKEHPVKVANGQWTSVIGTMQGTFTKPMPLPNGTVVQPTGKAFTIPMCTVGHWVDGLMDEEYLFWDNAGFMKQIGVS